MQMRLVVGLLLTVLLAGATCWGQGVVINEVPLVYKTKPFKVTF